MTYAARDQVRTCNTMLRLSPAVDADLKALAGRMHTSKATLARELTEIGITALNRITTADGSDLSAEFGITPTALLSKLIHESVEALVKELTEQR